MRKLMIVVACVMGCVNVVAQGVCGVCNLPIPVMADQKMWEKTVEANDLSDWHPTYTIDFLATFDPSAEEWALEHCGTLQAYAEHVVKSMNTVMHNSDLDGQFRLVGTFVTTQNAPTVPQGLTMAMNDEALRAEARRLEADVTLLFVATVGNLQPVSGVAVYMADPGMGLGCVHVDGGYNALTAIHETGHIMGCNHSRDVDLEDVHPYAYGAMRWIDGEQYSTVMGYHGTLLPHFSSPNYIYKGTVMGSDTEDNCRRISERLPEVVRLGEPRTNYELGRYDWKPTASAQQIQVELHGKKAYRITADQDWLDVSPTMGYLEEPFTITVKANDTGKARRGHVTVEDWDAANPDYTGEILGSSVVTVTQANAAGDYTVEGGDEPETILVSSITLSPTTLSLKVGDKTTVTASVLPANATTRTLNWSSSNEKVCSVSQGYVTAIAEGKATIRVKATDGSGVAASMEVTVNKNGGGEGGGEDSEEEYAVNFDKNLEATRTDRILSGVTLTEKGGEVQEISVSGATIYSDMTKQKFTVEAGAMLSADFQYSGSWMHGYIYVDEDHDGHFDISGDATPGQPICDLKSYSFYSFNDESEDFGYNSAAGYLSGNAINVLTPPAFTAPEKAGQYRMRYKIDWNCIDPAGKYGKQYTGNYINDNGGYIVDVTLDVVDKTDGLSAPELSTINCQLSTLYDLQGRVLRQQPKAGLYISGGRCVLR